MTRLARRAAMMIALIGQALTGSGAIAQGAVPDAALFATISGLDAKVFDAYNRCDLATFGSAFAPDVEFYHDEGGATFDRNTVVANTKKFICGKVHRELVAASLRIYPVKDFGAIEEGEHRFCEISTGKCAGIAKFVIVWKRGREDWIITRVLSYGHRTMTDAEQAALPQRP